MCFENNAYVTLNAYVPYYNIKNSVSYIEGFCESNSIGIGVSVCVCADTNSVCLCGILTT